MPSLPIFGHQQGDVWSLLTHLGLLWSIAWASLALLAPSGTNLEAIGGQNEPIEGPQGHMDLDLEPSLALGAPLTRQICPIWDPK